MPAEMAYSRRAAVVIASDRVAAGEAEDTSGRVLDEGLVAAGWSVVERVVVPDDASAIAATLERLADEVSVALVLTTGGTGLAPRDVTPDATRAIADREVPGIAEALRATSLRETPHAMLSRATAAIRGATLIVNLPGSPRGVRSTLAVLLPILEHATRLTGGLAIEDAEHRAVDR